MKAKKNAAKQPIGKGKKGSGKRAIYEAGGGKKALKTWRSLAKSQRKAIRKSGFEAGIMNVIKEAAGIREASGTSRVTGRRKVKPLPKATKHKFNAAKAKNKTKPYRNTNTKKSRKLKTDKNTVIQTAKGKKTTLSAALKYAQNTAGTYRKGGGGGGTGGSGRRYTKV